MQDIGAASFDEPQRAAPGADLRLTGVVIEGGEEPVRRARAVLVRGVHGRDACPGEHRVAGAEGRSEVHDRELVLPRIKGAGVLFRPCVAPGSGDQRRGPALAGEPGTQRAGTV